MHFEIGLYRSDVEERVVEFSLRAWTPVFASMREALGDEVFLLLYHDWMSDQDKAIREVLSDPKMTVWVATVDAIAVGYVATVELSPPGVVGVIDMLAVDPDYQGRGIGAALTETASAWLLKSGARVAMVETGGDPGHAPARRTYEKAGFGLMPIARYFRALGGEH
jgi:GNAT superfamily N-acetyltransferase